MARFIIALSCRLRGTDREVTDLTDVLEAGHVEKLRPEGRGRSPVAFYVALAPSAPIEPIRRAQEEEEPLDLSVDLSGVEGRQRVTTEVRRVDEEDEGYEIELWARPRRSLLDQL